VILWALRNQTVISTLTTLCSKIASGACLEPVVSLFGLVFICSRRKSIDNAPLLLKIKISNTTLTLLSRALAESSTSHYCLCQWLKLKRSQSKQEFVQLLSPAESLIPYVKSTIKITYFLQNLGRGGSRIFLIDEGAPLRNGVTEFFCRIPVIVESRISSREGEGALRTPCALLLDPPCLDQRRNLSSCFVRRVLS